jgi:hypothetical protein
LCGRAAFDKPAGSLLPTDEKKLVVSGLSPAVVQAVSPASVIVT